MKIMKNILIGLTWLAAANSAHAEFICSGNSQLPFIKLEGKTLKGIPELSLTLENPNTGETSGPVNYTWSAGSLTHFNKPLKKYSAFFYGPSQNDQMPHTLFLEWWATEEVDEPQFLLYSAQDGDPKVTQLICSHVNKE
jgi:hypothetical protein